MRHSFKHLEEDHRQRVLSFVFTRNLSRIQRLARALNRTVRLATKAIALRYRRYRAARRNIHECSTAQILFRNKHLIRKLCCWFKWKAKLLRMRRNPFVCDRPMKYSLRRLLRLQRFARDLLFRKKKLPFLRNELELRRRRARCCPKLYPSL